MNKFPSMINMMSLSKDERAYLRDLLGERLIFLTPAEYPLAIKEEAIVKAILDKLKEQNNKGDNYERENEKSSYNRHS